MYLMQKALRDVGNQVKDIGGFNFDINKAVASLVQLKSKIQALGIADIADVNVTQGRITSQLILLRRLVEQYKIPDLLDVNINAQDLSTQLGKIAHVSESIPVTFDVAPLKLPPASIEHIPVITDAPHWSWNATVTGVTSADAAFNDLGMSADKLGGHFVDLEKKKDSLSEDVDKKLTPTIRRAGIGFAGWGGILGGTIGTIGLWHVALDAAVEGAIALLSATAALTIGLATMAPAAQDIYTQMKSVSTVNSALSVQIPPLTGQFDALAQSMAPRTIEAFGGGLNLVNKQTGIFSSISRQVVTGLDDVVARVDIWNNKQQITGKLLQNGVGFLHQFNGILSDLTATFLHFVKADPGTVHFLLDIVQVGAKVLNWATSIPSPLFAVAIALHSIYLWGNVASGALGLLLKNAPGMSKLSAILSKGFGAGVLLNPWVDAAVLLGAAVAVIAINWDKADKATQRYIGSLDAALSQSSASNSIMLINKDIGDLTTKINAGFSSSSMSKVMGEWNTAANVGVTSAAHLSTEISAWHVVWSDAFKPISVNWMKDWGRAFKAAVDPNSGQIKLASNNVAAYRDEINKLVGQQGDLYKSAGTLVKSGYSLAQSFAIMDLAGIQVSDNFDLQQAKIKNLITGYNNLSAGGSLLTSNVDAVTFAALQQQSQITALNSGWDAFIGMLTGSESALSAFGAAIVTMNTSAHVSGASISGLNAQSLTLRGNFTASVTAANAQMDALATLASAAALGNKGVGMLSQATKDLVATLLPAAKGSSAMTTILYGLAQRGGYTAADSFSQLSKWATNTKSPMTNLDGIITTLTGDAGNLTQDVQNLSTALGQTLNDAMAQVILTETGGVKPMENLFNAIKTTGVYSQTTHDSAVALAQQYFKLTGTVQATQGEFETFAIKALGLTKKQADALWASISGSLTPSVIMTGAQAVIAGGKIDSSFVSSLKQIGFNVPTKAVDNFTNSILATGDASKRTKSARDVLIADLEHAGVQGDTARRLVAGLQKQIDALRGKTVNVGLTATGTGQVKISGTGIATHFLNVATGQISGGGGHTLAKGGQVPGWGGGDVWPALLEPGEAVIDKHKTRKYASILRMMGVPGFAGGGLVNQGAPSTLGTYETIEGRSAAEAFSAATMRDALKAYKQVLTPVGGPGGATGATGGGSASANAALARAIYPQYTSDPTIWNAWNYVAMRESGWNQFATNPSSGAYGIPQALPYNKMPRAAWPNWAGGSSDPRSQIIWMWDYMAATYGGPVGAAAHEASMNWYDNGGWLNPGWTMAYNGTGQSERVVSPNDPTGGIHITLELGTSFVEAGLSERQLQSIRYTVRTKGGHGPDAVQRAFGGN
jgi:hypothetical protein